MNPRVKPFILCLLLMAVVTACGNKGDLTRDSGDSDKTSAEQARD